MHQVCTGVSNSKIKQAIKSINSHTTEKKIPIFLKQIHVDQTIYVFKIYRYMLKNQLTFLHDDVSFTVVKTWLGLKIKKLELWPAELLWNDLSREKNEV